MRRTNLEKFLVSILLFSGGRELPRSSLCLLCSGSFTIADNAAEEP
jgi:hypothetical protein